MNTSELALTGIFALAVLDSVEGHPRKQWKRTQIRIGDTTKNIFTAENAGIALMAVGGIGYVAQQWQSNSRVNGMDLKTVPFPTIALAGGMLWGGSKIYKNAFPDSALAQNTMDANDDAVRQSQAAGQVANFSDAQYQNLADSIYEDVRYGGNWLERGSKLDDAAQIIESMNNDLDLAFLIAKFGLRQRTFFGLVPDGADKSLPQFVRELFGSDRIAALNSALAAKGIKYQF